jgi:ATP-dependent Clp protease, protease subunit
MQKENEIKNDLIFKSLISNKLLDSRTIMIFGEINQKLAQDVTEKLLILANESSEKIKIYINSQGGHVESGDTIYDMIRYLEPMVHIIGTGWVASAGALIYCAPPVEQRFCLPNTRFLLHQPSGGVGGQATDIRIEAHEIIKMRDRLNKILAERIGKPLEKIEEDTDRNFWMTAREAIDYGLAGKIISRISDLK